MSVRQGLRRCGELLVEALCPAIIVALTADSARRIVWNSYTERDVQIYATIARLWHNGLTQTEVHCDLARHAGTAASRQRRAGG